MSSVATGVIEIASGDLLRAGMVPSDSWVIAPGEALRTDVPLDFRARYEPFATQMSQWDGNAWQLVAQPAPPTTVKFLASSKIDAATFTTPGYKLIDGVLTTPGFFTKDPNTLFGQFKGEINVNGAADATLRIRQRIMATGVETTVGEATLPDTAGDWAAFTFQTDPAALDLAESAYSLEGDPVSALSLGVRFSTLALLEATT